jgi:integrase
MGVKTYIDKNGNTLWMAAICMRSKLHREFKVQRREVGFSTELEARAALKKLRDRAVLEVAQKEVDGRTWRQMIDAWEMALYRGDMLTRHLTAASVADYVGPVRKYTEDWMRKPCSHIVKNDVRRLILDIAKNVSPMRAKKMKFFLALAFRWAIDNDFEPKLKDNPVEGVSVAGLSRHSKRPDILTGDQIRNLLRAAKDLNSPWYWVWAMAVSTGMRSGELHALLWSDVNFEEGLISVTKSWSKRAQVKDSQRFPGGIKGTKTGAWRSIPINNELRSLLLELRQMTGKTPNVLPRIKAWDHNDQSKILRGFCEGIGIKPIVFHALRACFAVQLLQSNVPTVTVMAIGGWEDMKTMMIYVRMAGVDIQGATQNLKLLPLRNAMENVVPLTKEASSNG